MVIITEWRRPPPSTPLDLQKAVLPSEKLPPPPQRRSNKHYTPCHWVQPSSDNDDNNCRIFWQFRLPPPHPSPSPTGLRDTRENVGKLHRKKSIDNAARGLTPIRPSNSPSLKASLASKAGGGSGTSRPSMRQAGICDRSCFVVATSCWRRWRRRSTKTEATK